MRHKCYFFNSKPCPFDVDLKAFWLATVVLTASCGAAAFDLQGHRGARGLLPENTLAAFERALDIGVTTLELDVGITADGVAVVAHDPLLNPAITRDALGRWLTAPGPSLRSLTADELQRFDVGRIDPAAPYAATFATQAPRDGERIPRLREVFGLVKRSGADGVRFNIETKLNPTRPDETANPEVFVNTVVREVREAGLTQRVTLQSFDWRTLQIAQGLEPTLQTVYLSIQTANNDNIRDGAWTAGFKLAEHGSVPRMVKAAGGAVWSPNAGALTEALLREAQTLGLQVIPWTVNAPGDMQRFLDWKVDGLITDYPDRLREVMRQRGLPLPKGLKN